MGDLFRRLFLTWTMSLHETRRLAFYDSLAHLADRHGFRQHPAMVRRKC